jgi:hypothetical protein
MTDPQMPMSASTQYPSCMSLEFLRLEQIRGLHPEVTTVRAQTCGFLRDIPYGCISERGVVDIANYLPLHVVVQRGEYRCIGGARLFRLLQWCDKSTSIPVLVHAKPKPAALVDLIQLDLMIVPVFYMVNHKDIIRLGNAWVRPEHSAFFQRVITTPGKKSLASLIGCDARTVIGGKDVTNGSE